MSISNILILVAIVIIIYLIYSICRNVAFDNINDIDKDLSIKTKDAKCSKPEQFKTDIDNKTIYPNEPNLIMNLQIDGIDDIQSVELKLYDKDVPLTCKNFRILATKGVNNRSYVGSIFHRVIKDFMIQGGDIMNNDGTGSISIFGKQFEDENFKIGHTKKGLLSMANSGPDTNGSQFFITTTATPHLDNKHVVFGEVVSGYDIIEYIQNLSTDSTDKPYQQVKIHSFESK